MNPEKKFKCVGGRINNDGTKMKSLLPLVYEEVDSGSDD